MVRRKRKERMEGGEIKTGSERERERAEEKREQSEERKGGGIIISRKLTSC